MLTTFYLKQCSFIAKITKLTKIKCKISFTFYFNNSRKPQNDILSQKFTIKNDRSMCTYISIRTYLYIYKYTHTTYIFTYK